MDSLLILARHSSKRLSGKAVKPLGNETVIGHIISLAHNCSFAETILATSDEESDDILEEEAHRLGVKCFRGSLNNVAERIADCIQFFGIKKFARINGDSPFLRTDLLKKAFNILHTSDVDFVTNLQPRSFPYGIALEVFRSEVYLRNIKFFNDIEKEHVTSYFYQHLSEFNYENLISPRSYPTNVTLTIDDEDTYATISRMFFNDPQIAVRSLEEIIHQYLISKHQNQ